MNERYWRGKALHQWLCSASHIKFRDPEIAHLLYYVNPGLGFMYWILNHLPSDSVLKLLTCSSPPLNDTGKIDVSAISAWISGIENSATI
jgi:hypothetical protein